MTLNFIGALKFTFYGTKHTNNTKIHFQESNCCKKPFFRKLEIYSDRCFPPMFMARLENMFKIVSVVSF